MFVIASIELRECEMKTSVIASRVDVFFDVD